MKVISLAAPRFFKLIFIFCWQMAWQVALIDLSPCAGRVHNEGRWTIETPDAVDLRTMRFAIASPQETVPIDRALMRRAARTVLEGEGVKEAEVSLAFVDNPTIQQLNQRYLQHDEPTDVLSFPLSEPNAKRLAGELGSSVRFVPVTSSK